jgi:hypothetical protein
VVVRERHQVDSRRFVEGSRRARLFGELAGQATDIRPNAELEPADLEMIAVLKFTFSLNSKAVEESAVSAVEITNEHPAAPNQHGTVFFADRRVGRTKLEMLVATD